MITWLRDFWHDYGDYFRELLVLLISTVVLMSAIIAMAVLASKLLA